MKDERPTFRRVVRHPLTHRQITIKARSARELEAMLHKVDTFRTDRKLGLMTDEELDRKMGGLRGKLTVDDAAKAYAERVDLAPNTRRNAESVLSAYADDLRGRDVYELDGAFLTRWIERLKGRGLEPSTVGYAWHTLRAIVRYQVQIGRISREPWGTFRPKIQGARLSRNTREAARDVEELARIIAAAKLYDERQRRHGAISFIEAAMASASLLGIRQGEIAGLEWPDIDDVRRAVRIARQWDGAPTKNKRISVLLADDSLFELLAEHRAYLQEHELYRDGGPVFPSTTYSTPGNPRHRERGEHPLPPEIVRTVASLAELPNPERWSATSLRDSYATLEEQAKPGDLVGLAERTRHLSIASLVRYLRSRTREPAAPGFKLPPAPPRPPELPE